MAAWDGVLDCFTRRVLLVRRVGREARGPAQTARGGEEQQYVAALALATTYQVTGNRFELFRVDGGIAGSFEADRTR